MSGSRSVVCPLSEGGEIGQLSSEGVTLGLPLEASVIRWPRVAMPIMRSFLLGTASNGDDSSFALVAVIVGACNSQKTQM